ncbi:MAG: hypothetical protein HY902_18575 [Deltaproteobacteria bacterium]|nr:hypothetical protein [Deltaproteobacteria bacterium]
MTVNDTADASADAGETADQTVADGATQDATTGDTDASASGSDAPAVDAAADVALDADPPDVAPGEVVPDTASDVVQADADSSEFSDGDAGAPEAGEGSDVLAIDGPDSTDPADSDAAADSGDAEVGAPCQPTTEVCNGIDDDCNGATDESGAEMSCTVALPCAKAYCAQGVCLAVADTSTAAPCDDGNACTASDACSQGVCTGNWLGCDDGNPCTDDSCQAADGCNHAPNTVQCSDGSVCTTGDVCSGGSCKAGGSLACEDDNPCTADGCDATKGCQYSPKSGTCDDGDPCTTGDACKTGACVGAAAGCDDGNVCSKDSCGAGGCAHQPASGPCDDGDACTAGDACALGKCATGAPKNCNDGNACTTDGCSSATGCTATPTSTPCDDGNACTSGDSCASGICKAGGAKKCDDGDPCTADSCAASTGVCAHTAIAACMKSPCASAADCSSGQVCDDNTNSCVQCASHAGCKSLCGLCIATTCVAATPCTSSVQCKAEGKVCAADLGLCAPCNVSADCGGSGATCVAHLCVAAPQSCTSDTQCAAVCSSKTKTCVQCNVSADCGSGGWCGTDSACHPKVCSESSCVNLDFFACKADGGGYTKIPCDDEEPCTTDACDGQAKEPCSHVALPDATPCGNAGLGGKCGTGKCRYPFVQVANYGNTAYGVTSNGAAWAWGRNTGWVNSPNTTDTFFGTPGAALPTYNTPQLIAKSGVAEVGTDTGGSGICIRFTSGTVQCSGPSGTTSCSGVARLPSRDSCFVMQGGAVRCGPCGGSAISGMADAVEAAGTESNGAARISTGELYRWTWNSNNGAAFKVTGAPKVASLLSGSVALGEDGNLWTWADGTAKLAGGPSLKGAVAATGEPGAGCAVFGAGQVKCWGSNTFGQLGDGGSQSQPTGAWVQGLSDAVQVSGRSGDSHCAVRKTGQVVCWGDNTEGQLGSGTGGWPKPPTPIAGLGPVQQLVVGRYGACALTAAGAYHCWGSTEDPVQSPTEVPMLAGMQSLALYEGRSQGCGIKAGKAWCWGSNSQGQLGNGANGAGTDSATPVQVLNLSGLTGVATMQDSARCAWQQGGSAWCWGDGGEFCLGNGQGGSGYFSSTPVQVKNLGAVTHVVGGSNFFCALVSDGSIACWGQRSTQNQGSQFLQTATKIDFAEGVKALIAKFSVVAALRGDGTVLSWSMQTPSPDAGLPQPWQEAGAAIGIALAEANNFPTGRVALKADGTWYGSAKNTFGLLPGVALTKGNQSTSPETIPGLTGLTSVGFGPEFGCGLNAKKEVLCWGANSYGALGTGDAWSNKPVVVSWGP